VNIINLLASQWGELMTNVGDFDGRNTWAVARWAADGEWLVRVGTEKPPARAGAYLSVRLPRRIIAP